MGAIDIVDYGRKPEPARLEYAATVDLVSYASLQ